MTATTNPHPDVPLPAGAVFGDVWEGRGPERVVTGPTRGITDAETIICIIWTSAIQRADGRIAPDHPEPPLVHIDGCADIGLNSDRARELASVLLEAADEVDRWAQR